MSEVLYKIPRYQISLVRENSTEAWEPIRITKPHDIVKALHPYFDKLDREVFLTLQLDMKNKIIGHYTASVGTVSGALVHPREVFKAAILQNASKIICVHNHPSGDPEPSPEDLEITKKLKQAGDILGIEVLDHIIIGDGVHMSLRAEGMIF